MATITAETTATRPANRSTAGHALVAESEMESISQTPTITNSALDASRENRDAWPQHILHAIQRGQGSGPMVVAQIVTGEARLPIQGCQLPDRCRVERRCRHYSFDVLRRRLSRSRGSPAAAASRSSCIQHTTIAFARATSGQCRAGSVKLDRQLTLSYLWQRRVLADRSLTHRRAASAPTSRASSQATRLRLRRRRSSPRQRAEHRVAPIGWAATIGRHARAGGGTVTSGPAVPTDGGPTSAGGAIQSRTGPDDAANTNSTMATPVAALATILRSIRSPYNGALAPFRNWCRRCPHVSGTEL